MKLTHLANLLTIALLLVTAWLAWEASQEARKAGEKVDRLSAHQHQIEAQQPEVFTEAAPPRPAPPVVVPAPAAPSPAPTVTSAGTTPPPPAPPPEPTAASLAQAGNPASLVVPTAPSQLPPATLTPLQRRVRDAPALGKIKQFAAEHGFVVFDAPSDIGLKAGQKFDLRRDASIVGRVVVDSIDPDGVIANLDPKSVPEGVAILPGDDVISVMAPGS